MTTGSARPSDGFRFGYFCVAFVDLLGQQNAIAQLASLPLDTEGARDRLLEALRDSAGRVRRIRKSFQDFLSAASTNRQSLHGLSKEQQEQFLRMRNFEIAQFGFADSFVLSTSLSEQDGAGQPASAVWAMLYGLAGIHTIALAEGIPLRAGIDVDRGTDILPNEVYGPAAVNAYQLESKVAEYPRIAIGEGLLRYLEYLERSTGSFESPYVVGQADRSRRLICAAPDDGRPMVHTLSSELLTGPGSAEREAAQQAAYEWVKREAQRVSTDAKLGPRYARLLRYFNDNGFRG